MDAKTASGINNSFYDTLGELWYETNDHPIALLRAENKLRNHWVYNELQTNEPANTTLLDVGCGGGFLTNFIAKKGFIVTGIDLSEKSLDIAKKYDETKTVTYLKASAYQLPFPDGSFDAVSAMDILEHVENPGLLIKEASRVLKPNGSFLFHTFNRNLLSYILIIKAVEWFVNNTPKNMHVYSLFIKPEELKKMCLEASLNVEKLVGLVPDIHSKAFWKLAINGKVTDKFKFRFCKNTWTGYVGRALKI